jgi:uncharacterized protein (TIGR02118 family)
MVKLSVMYEGTPADATAFDGYYWSKHLPTVARWPKVRRIALGKGKPGDEFYQICDIFFDSRADLEAALASPERKVSADDVKNFPAFQGQIKRQTFEVRDFGAA